jgi:hypothetical protein
MLKFKVWTLIVGLLCITSTAQALLLGRDIDGNSVLGSDASAVFLYDTELNITWLRDANYAGTSGYPPANTNPALSGYMGWDQAKTWASTLTVGKYGGWRLPTMVDTGLPGCDYAYSGTDCGFNVQTQFSTTVFSELAYLFFVTLGNKSSFNAGGGYQCGICLVNKGDFQNLKIDSYWFGLEYATDPTTAWAFDFRTGYQAHGNKGNAYPALAVRTGDVLKSPPTLQSQAITFTGIANQMIGAAPYLLSATASSGLPVTFSSSTNSVCTIAGNSVTSVGTGTCTIAANQVGNATYAAAAQVLQSFLVLNTPIGSNVIVSPVDITTGQQPVTITFASIGAAGLTTMNAGSTAPAVPTGLVLCTPPVNIDISTTATFTGNATVCVNPAKLGTTCAANASLWHWTANAWNQLPSPTNLPAGQICGVTNSFSPFAIFASAPTAGGNDVDTPLPPWAYAVLAIGLLGSMMFHQMPARSLGGRRI